MNFITGSTGFVGSAILLEILKKTDQDIYCLVRPKKNVSGEDRLFPLLKELIVAYDLPETLQFKIQNQCKVIEGDLTDSSFINEVLKHKPQITQFWHVAASLNYEERFRDEIFEINVQGTRHALDLAAELGATHFNHFSTAYVAGTSTGVIKEEAIIEVKSNNVYEISKIEAENIVRNDQRFQVRIFRPSIVIGHSKTNHAFNFSGLYGFQRRVQQFKGIMERVQQNYFENNTIKILAEPDAFPNLVPVDFVAQNAVDAVLNNAPADTYHLTNSLVCVTSKIMNVIFEYAKLTPPIYTKDTSDFNWIDEKFNEKIEFYLSYLVGQKIFDRSKIDSVIPLYNSQDYLVDGDTVDRYCGWYDQEIKRSKRKTPVLR